MGDAAATTPATPGAELELSKTRLRVIGGELQRLNDEGGIAMRLPLEEIEEVTSGSRVDPFGPVCVLLALGVGAIAYFVSQYNIVTTLLYIVALALLALGILGFLGRVIVIRAQTGTTAIVYSDGWDEAAGFITSLRRLIGSFQPKQAAAPLRSQE